MDAIEKLPASIDGKYFLRIKKRGSRNKWCIRYVCKVPVSERTSFKNTIRGFTYKTHYQTFGTTLENAAKRAIKELNL
jgi:hypothetical protein